MSHRLSFVTPALILFCAFSAHSEGLHSQDLYKLHAVGEVEFSPDGKYLAYVVSTYSGPRSPSTQIWVMDMATRKTIHLGSQNEATSHPRWSPDSAWIAYTGGADDKRGLIIAHPDGSSVTFLAKLQGTNSPLPGQGENVVWSSDGKRSRSSLLYPAPKPQDATGDPVVITRYLYRPTASEGFTHFNDNRRLHISQVDVASKQVRQLTTGTHDEHSIAWSPDGRELLCESNHDPNSDEFFHYDIFAVKLGDGSIRRLTAIESCEYAALWSPNGKRIAYAGNQARGH